MKARSRLSSTSTQPRPKASSRLKPASLALSNYPSATAHDPLAYGDRYNGSTLSRHSATSIQKSVVALIFSKYLRHVPTLFLALACYAGVIYLVTTFSPTVFQNWLFPRSYLPFQISLFIANFFLFSFLTLNSRRGYLLALVIQSLVFLKLQLIEINSSLVIFLLVIFVIMELIGLILERIFTIHAGFHSKSVTQKRRQTH